MIKVGFMSNDRFDQVQKSKHLYSQAQRTPDHFFRVYWVKDFGHIFIGILVSKNLANKKGIHYNIQINAKEIR